MAGKSNRGKNRKGTQFTSNSSKQAVPSDAPSNEGSGVVLGNGDSSPEIKDKANADDQHQAIKADVHIYPVSVKTPGGEKLDLHLSPGDTAVDVRQFLLDSTETCFLTCYDLLLHTNDGAVRRLEDYNEIFLVADITSGSCFLEMIPALYDDRSIRAHVQRTRELLSFSALRSSLSTMLAMQHEARKNAPVNTGDAVKAQVAELDNLGLTENFSSLLSNLFPSTSKDIRCIESFVFSSFNPPPSYRRLAGDLIYLDVVTLEGNKYCITGTTKVFYVNASTGNVLDPRPSRSASEAGSLVGLLQKISPKFKKAFHEILEYKASMHPYENAQSMFPPNSWLGTYPVPDHKRDAARAEDSLTLSLGSELIGMQRDWNEELQSCREFACDTNQERILRDRALYRVTCDFADAATNGAIGVINRCIPPINPTDDECLHMYVHNNIFFSFATDSDLEQLPRKQGLEENSKVEVTYLLQNRSQNADISNNDGTGAVQCPDMPSESHLAEGDQATYASSNNDLKGTKAFQEVDVPGLYNLAMAIIDYRGHRVVAQSILPGILHGDKSDALRYGSVDYGKKIYWNEDFHSKVLEAAKRLHLKEHSVLDSAGNVFKLAAPVECKGIVGSDDRDYLLDLMRVTPRDANYMGSDFKCCILRPELINAFCREEAGKKSTLGCSEQEDPVAFDSLNFNKTEERPKATEDMGSAANNAHAQDSDEIEQQKVQEAGAHSNGGSTSKEIFFNPDVFTEFKLAGNQEDIAADEENVLNASLYLKDVVLPKFIKGLSTLEVSPMDGQTLTEALHSHGINIRYLGKVAEQARHMPHFWDLISNEIVVRSAKHIVKEILRDAEDHDIGQALSHFFNCFLGKVQFSATKVATNGTQSKNHKRFQVPTQDPLNSKTSMAIIQAHSGHSPGKFVKGQPKLRNGGYMGKKQSLYTNISSDSLWSDIQEFAKLKYQFELPEDSRERVKKIQVIRNLCQKVGITISARKYDFDAPAPFHVSDILDIKPVVKHSIPICSEAKDLVETGKVQLDKGLLSEAYTLLSEAFAMLQQVTGPVHREVANCCRYLAMVLYHAGDIAGAIMQQHKELLINERCLGLDHPDTAHSYGNMALFYHSLNQTDLALRHMSRALFILCLSCGPNHPDVAATYINVAMMYQDIGKMGSALRYLQEAVKMDERLLGEDHFQTAMCYHSLAMAFNYMGTFKLSHQHEKKTYDILVNLFGEDDERTKEAHHWLKTFKMRELQMNAQKQKSREISATSAEKAIDILKAHPGIMQALEAAAAANSTAPLTTRAYAGNGVDKRAARAAAEVRKKAAARGIVVRPHGVPVEANPPLTKPHNVLTTSESAKEEESSEVSNGVQVSQEKPDQKDSKSGPTKPDQQQDQPPVGLGRGLGSLDAKKSKGKGKGKKNKP